MDICSSRYLVFVDADDWCHPDMLKIMWEKMMETDSDIVQCNFEYFRDKLPNQKAVDYDYGSEVIDLQCGDARKRIINELPATSNLVVWGKLYSTEFLFENRIRFIENRFFEDNHFSFLCALLAKKYCRIHLNLYGYFMNDSGSVGTMRFEKVRDLKYVVDQCRKEIVSRELERTVCCY